MTSLEAAAGRPVSRETLAKLERFADLLRAASAEQNLVSAASLDSLWERHILDSAQLVRYESGPGASWGDIGSGAGLPGVVIAALVEGPVTLVEPRRLRAKFLEQACAALGFGDRVRVAQAKSERLTDKFDMIAARALAPLDRLLTMTRHLSRPETVWVLPKGRSAKSELAEARRNWHCAARVEPSVTDPQSRILVLAQVGAKQGR